jgi:MFS transporter, FHS family, Na+ dependent glucose transporter 1
LPVKSLRKNPYVLTGFYYSAFVGLGLTTASFGPTLQGLANNTGSTLAQISSLFLVRSFGYLLGSVTGGRIYDRVKGHPVLCVILLGIVAILWGVPVMRSIYFLGALLFVLGFGEGMLDVGANTLVFWLHGDHVPPFMNGLHAFFGVGTTIAPLIVAQVLLRTDNIAWSYWILGLLIIPSAVGLLGFKSPSAPAPSVENTNRTALQIPLLVISCLLFFLYVGSELGFSGWIYTYTIQRVAANSTTAAGINAAFWGGFTVSRLLSIPLSIRLKPDKILWIDLLGTIASLLFIIILPGQLWALWIGAIGTGVFMASIFPTILNDAQTRMHMSGNITSWFFVGASLGGMILPFLIGQIIGPYGPQSAIFAVLASMVGTLLLFCLLIVIRRPTPPPQPVSLSNNINS